MRYTVIHISTIVILVGVFTRTNGRHASREVVQDHVSKTKKSSPSTPYEFGYEIQDKDGNRQHRHEESDSDGVRRGSYGYVDANGIYRKVEYIADKNGFRVKEMKSNEPGLDDKVRAADVVKSPESNSISQAKSASKPYGVRKLVKVARYPKEREVNNIKVLASMKYRPELSDVTSTEASYAPPISSFIDSPTFKSSGQDSSGYDSYLSIPLNTKNVSLRSPYDSPAQSSYSIPTYQEVKGGRKTIPKYSHVSIPAYGTKEIKLQDYSTKGQPSPSYLNEPIDGYTLLKAIESKPQKSSSYGEEVSRYPLPHFEPKRIPSQSSYVPPMEPTKYPYESGHSLNNVRSPSYLPSSVVHKYPPETYKSSSTRTPYNSMPQAPYMNSYTPPTHRPSYTTPMYESRPPPPTPSYSPSPYTSSSYKPEPYSPPSGLSYSPSTAKKMMTPSVYYADESSEVNYPPPEDLSSFYTPRSGSPPPDYGWRGSGNSSPLPGSLKPGSWYEEVRSRRPTTLVTPRDTIPSVILGIQVALQNDHQREGSAPNSTSSLPSDAESYNPSHYPSHHQIKLLRKGLGKLIPLLHKKDISNLLNSNNLSASATGAALSQASPTPPPSYGHRFSYSPEKKAEVFTAGDLLQSASKSQVKKSKDPLLYQDRR